jgi:hypothetical protein
MDAATYIGEHPEIIQRAVNSRLERARLCIENRGGNSEQLQDVSNKIYQLIHLNNTLVYFSLREP